MMNRVLPGPEAIWPDSKGALFSGVGLGSRGLITSLKVITSANVATKRKMMYPVSSGIPWETTVVADSAYFGTPRSDAL